MRSDLFSLIMQEENKRKLQGVPLMLREKSRKTIKKLQTGRQTVNVLAKKVLDEYGVVIDETACNERLRVLSAERIAARDEPAPKGKITAACTFIT